MKLPRPHTAALLAAACLSVTLWGCDGKAPQDLLGDAFADVMPPTPSEAARDMFNISDPDKRRNSINLLSNASWGGEKAYLEGYRLLVDDPDPTVRAAALRALGKHGEPSDTAAIIPYLGDPTNFVRWEAAIALQRLHDPAAVDPLIVVAREDEDPDVRAAAANALGQYPTPQVFQTLVGALLDDDYYVVTEAVRSLRTITGQEFGEDGADWLAWAEKQDDPFAGREPYFYPQYVKPRGFIDKVQVWKEPKELKPAQPRGTPANELVSKPVDDSLNDDLSGDNGPG